VPPLPRSTVAAGRSDNAEPPLFMACAECGLTRDGAMDQDAQGEGRFYCNPCWEEWTEEVKTDHPEREGLGTLPIEEHKEKILDHVHAPPLTHIL